MSRIYDETNIRHISIPGTHDSGARYGGDSAQTQSLSIKQQLNAGIRYLDIRLRHINNAFTIHHGFVYQKMDFDGVLSQVRDFLKANPSEFVFIKVDEEYNPKDNTRSFNETFKEYVNRYKASIWTPGNAAVVPISEVRGKIVFIQGFEGSSYTLFGLLYSSFDIQNDYSVKTNWDLYSKWEKVKAQINKANNKNHTQHNGFINQLSASGGSFPYFVASGHSSPQTGASRLSTGLTTPGWKNKYPDFPLVTCALGICTIAFEGTNILTKNYLTNNAIAYAGIIVADFPGSGLIDAVINCNFR